MNIIFSTMGKSIDIAAMLIDLIKGNSKIGKIGLFVADSKYYNKYVKKNSFINDRDVFTVKEWEYTDISGNKAADPELIRKYEEDLDDLTFWNALMADRRIFFGPYCKYKQDYPSRFSYEELQIILQQALQSIEEMFDRVKPDAVISFGMATLGDYLIYLFAKKRNVAYRQLKATKIKNYLSFNDTPCGVSSHILNFYEAENEIDAKVESIALDYMDSVVKKGLMYEGAILSSRSRLMNRLTEAPVNMLKGVYGEIADRFDPVVSKDCHVSGSFLSAYYYNIVQPLRAYFIEQKLKNNRKYVEKEGLNQIGDYVFFPLHFEPEVSLQVFGKPYQNQIELIRNIAQSVPVGTKVVVKEHPRSLGFRPYSYYKKLLEIPNVFIVNPFLKGHDIVKFSKVVAVITGSIGLEAAICKKPVITFGNTSYNILPQSMLRHISSLSDISSEIKDLLLHYSYDEKSLLRYVCSFIQGSVPVDLYSVLLNKKGRFSENEKDQSHDERYQDGLKLLSDYCLGSFDLM